MRSTSIVHKIDRLGRVVIPKEIRKYTGINEGDSIEIFVNENEIILRKYSESDKLIEIVKKLRNEFMDVKKDMDTETANKIWGHINALHEIIKGIN